MKTARANCPHPHPYPRRLACAALVLGAVLAAAPAWAFDLPALAAMLAARRSAEARFTEERFVAGLEHPLRASGTLSYSAPDRFARYTLAPRAESMVVVGNTVVLTRGGRTRQLALDTVPELTALVEAVRGTLSGDVERLHKHFRTTVDGNAGRWKLTLVPHEDETDHRLGAQVRQLEIEGRGSDLRSVVLLLAGGDRSVMLIEPVSGPVTEPLTEPMSGPRVGPLTEPAAAGRPAVLSNPPPPK